MKDASSIAMAIAGAVMSVGPATAAPTRSADSLPALPSAASNASARSQGLPTADGQKPGVGQGKGHEFSQGKGHEIGRGHGHDDDEAASPG